MGYFRALSNTSYQVFEGMPDQITEGFGDHLSWELGAMRNVGERSALGGTLLIGFGEPDFRDAVKGRYRHWLTATRSLEASAGMLRTSVGTWRTTPGVGVTADVQVNFADRVALTVRVDQLRTKDFGTARAVYGGATLGSRPALAGTGTLLLVGGLMVLLFVASEGGS